MNENNFNLLLHTEKDIVTSEVVIFNFDNLEIK